jgi:NADH dehydrogenase
VPHRVVIVGGGFAGLLAARGLGRAPVEITLVDRRNHHLFQPLLYQVATGGLSPAEISAPLRSVLRRQRNTRVLLAEVVDLDTVRRAVTLDDGELAYDTLIVAAGVDNHYFGHDDWAARAPGLKTIEDATRIRSRILSAYEAAEREPVPAAGLRTFVIVGGGPTGVELAGALGELARHTLRRDFRNIDTTASRILLVEGAERILPGFPSHLAAAAARSLERLGVEIRTRTLVSAIDRASVVLTREGTAEPLPAATVLWAAGVRATPLAARIAARTGAPVDRAGRLEVAPDCTIPGHPEILVLGDMASLRDASGRPLPGVAPVAMQQGRYAARLVRDRLRGRATPPFRYRDKGSLAVIGRAAAVADLGRLQLTGYPAWLLWLFVHIMYLVGFERRLLVFIQWAYSYFTRNRGARLITGQP